MKYHNDIKANNFAFDKKGNLIIADYDICGNQFYDYNKYKKTDVKRVIDTVTRDIHTKDIPTV